jgi:hypothetical protein
VGVEIGIPGIETAKWGVMKTLSRTIWISAAAVAAFLAPPRARATAELTLSDGAGHTATVVAASCGTGCEAASFNGVLGSWNINVTTGTSTPGQSPEIDLNSINHHNASSTPSTLTIEWSDDSYTPAASGFQLNVGGTVGAHGTVTAALFGGTTDTEFDLSNQIGTTLTFTSPPVAFSGSESAYLTGLSASPYALTEVVTISFGKFAGQASLDFSVDAIPEPSAVVLMGTLLLLSGTAIRRRVRRG